MHLIPTCGNSGFHFLGKFVGVTIQSGCSSAPWAIQPNPAKHAEDLAQKLGCPTVPSTDMVDCIRTFSPRAIMKVRRVRETDLFLTLDATKSQPPFAEFMLFIMAFVA